MTRFNEGHRSFKIAKQSHTKRVLLRVLSLLYDASRMPEGVLTVRVHPHRVEPSAV